MINRYELVFYIYLIALMLIGDSWFHDVLIHQSSSRKNILEKSKKSKRYNQKNFYVRIAY